MTDRPAITILLATANRADVLGEAIESVLGQSHKDFELLVLDCRSEDDTESVVRSVSDPRVRYLYSDRADRAGVCAEGLSHSRGDFVAFMDVQARWHRDFLAELHQALSGAPESMGVAYAPAELHTDEKDGAERIPAGEAPEGDLRRTLFSGPLVAPASMLIRAKPLKTLSQNRHRFWLTDDYTLSLWLACQTRFKALAESRVTVRTSAGQGVRGLDPVSEARGKALLRCLHDMPGKVPGRFGRQCLAGYYGDCADQALAQGRSSEAFGNALQGLLYTPFSIRAWRRLVRISVSG
ncbi:MAG: glycosyltransferase family A protein [Oleiphilaceae bacterium]|nr:glycosyltransferase family A protein [Oleiphilaceae bacterium]